jgi:plastocyanin
MSRETILHASTRSIGRTLRALGLAIGLIAGASCGSGERPGDAKTTLPHASHHAAKTDEVVMRLIAYQPNELNVPVRSTVTWKQNDAGFHTVTSGTVKREPSGAVVTWPDGTFASRKLATGDAFAFTFDDAGAYAYFCEIHPSTMTGRVSVG